MSKTNCKHCKYSWNYKGRYTKLTTCPNCQLKTPIHRTAEELQLIEQIKELEEEEMKEVNNIGEEEV